MLTWVSRKQTKCKLFSKYTENYDYQKYEHTRILPSEVKSLLINFVILKNNTKTTHNYWSTTEYHSNLEICGFASDGIFNF